METPTDLKETEWKDFAGTVVYRTKFDVNSSNAGDTVLNLGKVYGISQVLVNGVDCGVKWYGNRIYDIADQLHTGSNEIEVRVVTVLGNYMHTLTDNATAHEVHRRQERVADPVAGHPRTGNAIQIKLSKQAAEIIHRGSGQAAPDYCQ